MSEYEVPDGVARVRELRHFLTDKALTMDVSVWLAGIEFQSYLNHL